MSKIDEIKQAVQQLSPEELRSFRDWLDEQHSQLWDDQIERDAKAGKLDWLADKLRADYNAGTVTDLDPTQRPARR
jgi:hypothetical protein